MAEDIVEKYRRMKEAADAEPAREPDDNSILEKYKAIAAKSTPAEPDYVSMGKRLLNILGIRDLTNEEVDASAAHDAWMKQRAAAAAIPKSEKMITFDSSKAPSLWDALWGKRVNADGSEALPSVGGTPMDALATMDGLSRTGIREGYNRLATLGKEGAGAEDWQRALKGNAPGFGEVASRNGFGPVSSTVIGLLGDTLTAPSTSMMARGVKGVASPKQNLKYVKNKLNNPYFEPATADAPESLKGFLDYVKNIDKKKELMMIQNEVNPLAVLTNPAAKGVSKLADKVIATTAGAVTNPLAKMANKAGRWIGAQPWRKADSDILKRTDSKKMGSVPLFSRQAFDARIGGWGKSNADIKNEIDALGKQNYDDFHILTDGIGDIDLSPLITRQAEVAGAKAVRAAKNQQRRLVKAATPVEAVPGVPDPNDVLLGVHNKPPQKVTAPAKMPDPLNEDTLDDLRKTAADAFKAKQKEELMSLFNSGPNGAEKAAQRLAEMSPDMAGPIEEAFNNLITTDSETAAKAFKKVMDIAFIGPRSVDDTMKLGTNLGNIAAGSEKFGTSAYHVGGKISNNQKSAMGARKTIGELITDRVGQQIEKTVPKMGLGEKAKEAFVEGKRKYGAFVTGKQSAVDAVRKAEAAPWFSKTDAAAGGYSAAKGDPATLAALLAGKLAQYTYKSPRFASSVGYSVHDLGNTGLWDAILRQEMISNKEKKK